MKDQSHYLRTYKALDRLDSPAPIHQEVAEKMG